jgi:ADP-ribose pyrophosphatase YjhB (NUDIX family)
MSDDEAGRWRRFGERAIYADPAVWLGQIDVKPPDRERRWNHVVRLRRAVTVMLLDDQDQVLLLWRYRLVKDRLGWELPDDLVHEEEEPAAAAARVLDEQAGYRAGFFERVITFEPQPGMVDAEQSVYVGRRPTRVHEPAFSGGEIAGLGWISIASLPRLISDGTIWTAGSLVALLGLLAIGA